MYSINSYVFVYSCRSQLPRGLWRESTAARLLGLWDRITPEAWMSVCCECCVLSGGGLCDGLIIRPEKSYRLWCIVVCDLETSRMRRPWTALGRNAKGGKILFIFTYEYYFTVWVYIVCMFVFKLFVLCHSSFFMLHFI